MARKDRYSPKYGRQTEEEPMELPLEEIKPVVEDKPKNEEITVKQPIEKSPTVVAPKPKIQQAPPKPKPALPKRIETKKFSFSGFLTFEQNYAKIKSWLDNGWKIKEDKKTTTDHVITLIREI